MNQVWHDRYFGKQVARLDPHVRQKLAALIEILEQNPYDPRLHTKHLSEPFAGVLSFRVTRDWRVTFHFNDTSTIQLLEVKHRKDIYR